jgi:hypothetical protein
MIKTYRNVTFNTDGTLRGEWSLPGFGTWLRFSRARLDLLWIEAANDTGPEVMERLWALQDGYGEPGSTPPQGWDWSGIRDSSEEAKARMLTVAAYYLPWPNFLTRLGLPSTDFPATVILDPPALEGAPQ